MLRCRHGSSPPQARPHTNELDLPRLAARGQRTNDLTTRRLLACGVAGPPLFVAVFLIEGAVRSGYHPAHNFVSALSLGQRGWIQIANFLVSGALALCFAAGLRRHLPADGRRRAAPILFGASGLSMIVAGLFVTDPSLGYPPGTPAAVPPTLHGAIHNVAGYTIFITLTAGAFLLARPFPGHPAGRAWKTCSEVTGALVALSFVAGQAVAALEQHGALAWAPAGLLQRTAIVAGSAWSAALALRLLRSATRPAGQ